MADEIMRKCAYCGKQFKARDRRSRYCSPECNAAYWADRQATERLREQALKQFNDRFGGKNGGV